MKKLTYALLFLTTLSAYGTEPLLNENFSSGKIPSDFILLDLDGLKVDESCFDRKYTSPGPNWFIAETDNGGDGAFSISRRSDAQTATDNWLITRKLSITSEDTWFSWRSHSVHSDYPESYEIVAFTDENMTDVTTLATIDAESYYWTTRVVSLKDYVGSEIYLAVRHTSTHKYMLAVDDLYVGQLTDVAVEGKNIGRHFFSKDKDGDKATIRCSLRNSGRPLNLSELRLTIGEESYTLSCKQEVASGTVNNYEFSIPVNETGTSYDYTIHAIETNGSEIKLLSDYFTYQNYNQKILVEKYTGMWCTTCTAANPHVHDAIDLYGDEIAVVEVHVAGNTVAADPLYNYPYYSYMNIVSVPTIKFNRNNETYIDNHLICKRINSYIKTFASNEVFGKIESAAQFTDDGKVKITNTVQFSKNIDNSNNNYSIGYIIKENNVQSDSYTQVNNCTSSSDREFYYLPTSIPGSLMIYNNVARGGETEETFQTLGTRNGIKGNIPATITAKQDYTVESIIELPPTVSNIDNVQIIAVLFHYSTATNLCQIDKIEAYSGVDDIQSDDSSMLVSENNGDLSITLIDNTPYEASVYGVDGKQIASTTGIGNELKFDGLKPGCYILCVKQCSNTSTAKIIIK